VNAKSKIGQHRTFLITATLLVLWNLSIWLLSENCYLSKADALIEQETARSQERAGDLSFSIRRNLNYLYGIPDLISELSLVKRAVAKFGTSSVPSPLPKAARVKQWSNDKTLKDLNKYLDFSARSLNADSIFVVNAAGDLIASSNWDTATSSIGITVAERSYFRQNKNGQSGMQYAMGKATKIPGLYFSTPISINEQFFGAAVVKIEMPNLSFLIKQVNAFVVDNNGVVILARNEDLLMSSLANSANSQLSRRDKTDLYLRDDFPVLKIEPWADKRLAALVRIQDSDIPHLLVSKRLPEFGLTVYVDSEIAEIPSLRRNHFWFAILLSALGSVLILIGSGSVMYFESHRRSKALQWKQASFDMLTALPNREMLRDRLAQEIKRSHRSGLPLALMLIDLDRFKEVNSTLGHDVGDRLLNEAARRIANCVRDSDTVSRLAGDEFVVVLPQVGNASHVGAIAQKIIAKLAEPYYLRNEITHLSASLGITLYPDDATVGDDLLKNADQAMRVAKNNGRNRFSYFTLALQENAQKRLHLVSDLREALAKNQFRVYFQPIIELSSGEVHKAEALLRWIHPERGMIGPADFIPLAEETRLILEIGAWVRTQSVLWCKRWNELYPEEFQISVNRSPVEFLDDSGIASVASFIDYLREHNMSGKNFVFEITEGMLLNLPAGVSKELLTLRDAGIQVAVDDFGAGYSSLSCLKKLHIDYLKIDKSFVSNLEPDSDDLALCEAIINMAHKIRLKVIAEGVETEQQLDLLAQADCDYAQGYLFCRPIPPEEFEIWMKKKNQQLNGGQMGGVATST